MADRGGAGYRVFVVNEALDAINAVIWADAVLYFVLAAGGLFTVLTGFSQVRALTHGVAVLRGRYDDPGDPGAINHFQALSAALSATVGLGNIGGVAVAIALGGPGAVFWMWVIGFAGMALKTGEVTLTMLHRNTDDPKNPHGGPMYVADKGLSAMGFPALGRGVAILFCLTLLVSTFTGGNMFQAWNVAAVTKVYFGVPELVSGVVLAVLVGAVILGGIERIGRVAGRLVPAMCVLYLGAAVLVLAGRIESLPGIFVQIVRSAFSPAEAQGAFVGASAGYAFLWGMKRALFSSEAGQGSSPIAHAAVKTREPVREAVVAGLEPFIDTIVVCTLTALVILSSGLWNRPPDLELSGARVTDGRIEAEAAPGPFEPGGVFAVVAVGEDRPVRVPGELGEDGSLRFDPLSASTGEVLGVWRDYPGATLTAKAFDAAAPGLGMILVTVAAWLFALSTIISWSYYGEQGVIYLLGERPVRAYRLAYAALVIVPCWPGLIRTDAELDNWTALGTGVMLWSNIPIMLLFAPALVRAWRDYVRRLDAGEFVVNRR